MQTSPSRCFLVHPSSLSLIMWNTGEPLSLLSAMKSAIYWQRMKGGPGMPLIGLALTSEHIAVIWPSVLPVLSPTSVTATIRAALMRRRHESVSVIGPWLNRVVRGYFNYHAVPTNLMRLDGFRSEVCRAWRHALLRRSQRHRLGWDRFNRLATRFLPYPRKLHDYPERRFHPSPP